MNEFLAEKLLDELLAQHRQDPRRQPDPEDRSDRFVTHVLVPAQPAVDPSLADDKETETQEEPDR